MELKIVCDCGQKYKFDAEPVGGRMPYTVNCPVCQADGTAAANALIAAQTPPPPPAGGLRINRPDAAEPAVAPTSPPPPIAPVAGGLKINRSEPAAPAASPPPPVVTGGDAPPAIGAARPFAMAAAQNPPRKTSFGMGLLGGFIGALVGSILYFLIYRYTGLHFRLLAVGAGGLAGWFADYLGKGEGSKELGGITAVFVIAGIIGAIYLEAGQRWREHTAEQNQIADTIYNATLAEAKEAVKAVPTGSDAEIRAYLVKQSTENGQTVTPESVSSDDVRDFHDNQLPQYQQLASGQMSKEDFFKANSLKVVQSKEEQADNEDKRGWYFMAILFSRITLFSLAAAAALAFKLSTNA